MLGQISIKANNSKIISDNILLMNKLNKMATLFTLKL